jgi:ribonuclease HI
MTKATIHVSGSCDFSKGTDNGNGNGGWGFLARFPETDEKTHGSGEVSETTHNRMELMAAIEALEALPQSLDLWEVKIVSKTTYLVNGIKNYLPLSKHGGGTLINGDLWERLDLLCNDVFLTSRKIDKSRDSEFQELADLLAQKASGVKADHSRVKARQILKGEV